MWSALLKVLALGPLGAPAQVAVEEAWFNSVWQGPVCTSIRSCLIRWLISCQPTQTNKRLGSSAQTAPESSAVSTCVRIVETAKRVIQHLGT